MRKLYLLFILAFVVVVAYAQAPQGINYQAVARNAGGQVLATQSVGIRISIIDASPAGAVQFSETFTVTTNQFGLFNIVIGNGNLASGSFTGITWSTGLKFIKVEIDPAGGTAYIDMGTTKFQSVPFALYANGATGPQGPQGPQGAQGPQGPAGAAGSANISGTTSNLIKFTGATTGGNSAITENGTVTSINSKLIISNSNGAITFNDTTGSIAFPAVSGTPPPMITMFASGAANANRMVIAHSPAYPDWGLMYSDPTDVWYFVAGGNKNITINPSLSMVGIGTSAPSTNLDVVGNTKTTTFTMTNGAGANKILTSDAAGNASWQNQSVYTTITPPGCQSLAATNSFAKIGSNLGSFTKINGATKVEVTLQTFLSVGTLTGANGIYYELRVDDIATSNGKAEAVLNTTGVYSNVAMTGLFTGLSAGTHTISLWAKTNAGTATNVMYDSGCWGSSNVMVKEVW
jgi:hypothetical protein